MTFRVVSLAALALPLALSQCSDADDPGDRGASRSVGVATFVGGGRCAECHTNEAERWHGSHHDLAMQEATAATVLADFVGPDGAGTTFTHHGVTSRFSVDGDRYVVETDGPDGELATFEIRYVFGVDPLQQYLVEFPGGRKQALSIAWDTRPTDVGGQRWYHVYGDERIDHTDELHWTKRSQNWNLMCAECHSTNLQKGYDLATDAYETTWSEIDVSCEACHGPGSSHVAWATRGAATDDPTKGLEVLLRDPAGFAWTFAPGARTAHRVEPRTSRAQEETCARCHARRTAVTADYRHGQPLLDTHRPAFLTERLYHADGQILDEVYVYGSFVQSRMYHQGVGCSDCHDPHSLSLRAEGNALCAQCHDPSAYDTREHHFHEPGTVGAACVECHMPAKHYMVVDPRRDHSIRVPRPDLTVAIGTPNACTGCHADQPAKWAADAVERWYGDGRSRAVVGFDDAHYGQTLAAAWRGEDERVVDRLAALARDPAVPSIARGSALAAGAEQARPLPRDAVEAALGDADPWLRLGALESLANVPIRFRAELVARVLDDPVRAVRIEAARLFAPARPELNDAALAAAFDAACTEYVDAQLVHADRAWAHVNLGLLRLALRDPAGAERAYRDALAREPGSARAAVNLADLYRELERDADGEAVLREALRHARNAPDVRHALGLLLVRMKRLPEAVAELETAAALNPANAHYAFVHAIAVEEVAGARAALRVVDAALERHPRDARLLQQRERLGRAAGRGR